MLSGRYRYDSHYAVREEAAGSAVAEALLFLVCSFPVECKPAFLSRTSIDRESDEDFTRRRSRDLHRSASRWLHILKHLSNH